MPRRLNVAPEVAQLLPASHLAQLESDVDNRDNRCLICGDLIAGPEVELVALHDDRAILARMAHPDCIVSGAYRWDRTSDAIAALASQMDGLDIATGLMWRRTGNPSAIVLAEPRMQLSAEHDDDDPLQRLFADPLGLYPVSEPIAKLSPPATPTCHLEVQADGLLLVSERLRISVPSPPDVLADWTARAGTRALLLIGRGLGLNRDDRELHQSLGEALRHRPTWAAVVTVAPAR